MTPSPPTFLQSAQAKPLSASLSALPRTVSLNLNDFSATGGGSERRGFLVAIAARMRSAMPDEVDPCIVACSGPFGSPSHACSDTMPPLHRRLSAVRR